MPDDLKIRVAELERRLDRMEPHVNRFVPLGPRELTEEEIKQQRNRLTEAVKEVSERVRKDAVPVDRTKQELTSGVPVPDDRSHSELKSNGQQKDYVVLSPEERAKGFVRPVRQDYRHKGAPGPQYSLRDLTADEHERYDRFSYVKFEEYPDSESSCDGRFWTQQQLDNVGKGCGTKTTMSLSIAETYARDPKFYGGTFCCGCGKHLPLNEFVWDGTDQIVGS